MDWQDVLVRLGARADRQIRILWDRHLAGQLDRDEFVSTAAMLVAASSGRAAAAAALAVAAATDAESAALLSAVDEAVTEGVGRLAGAVDTVLDDRPDTVDDLEVSRSDRLARLARAETLSAGQTATQTAWAATGIFDGWVRRTDADPCPLCIDLADGVKRPWTVRMASHVGCGCLAVPA